jgi:hypothetical protein
MIKTGNKILDGVLVLAIVILVFTVLNNVLKLIKTFSPGGSTETRNPEDEPFKVNPDKLTYPEDQYSAWADTLEQLFKEGLTEDEDAIKAVFYNLRTDSDFAALTNAFGVRRGYWFFDEGNLFQFLTAYLSDGDRADINQHNKNFGIKYRV